MDLAALTPEQAESLSPEQMAEARELRGEDGKLVYHHRSKVGQILRTGQEAADDAALEAAFPEDPRQPGGARSPSGRYLDNAMRDAPSPAPQWPTCAEVFREVLVQYAVSGVRGKSIKMLHDHAREAVAVYKAVRDHAWGDAGPDEVPPHWNQLCAKYDLDPESGEPIKSEPAPDLEVTFSEDMSPAEPDASQPREPVALGRAVAAAGYDSPPPGLVTS